MRVQRLPTLGMVGIFLCGGALWACGADDGDVGATDSGTGGAGDGDASGSGGSGVASGGATNNATGGGGTGGSGQGTGGGGAVDCASLPLCATFDADALGAAPAGFGVVLGYSGSGSASNVAVTNTQSHSGTQSVKVAGASEIWGITYPNPGETFYFRSWLKVEELAGQPVIIGLGPDLNSEVRMRLVKKGSAATHSIVANAANGDGLSPPKSDGSAPCTDCVSLPTDWFCFEMYVDKATQTLQFWVDGAQAVNLENNAPWHSSGTWPSTVQPLRIGSMALEGGGATLYIDDVAIGPSRLGCGG